MVNPNCQKIIKGKRISVKGEHKRRVVFSHAAVGEYVRTKIDGCVVSQGLRADWVVSRSPIGHIVVELKGKDVEHALKQVAATCELWKTYVKVGEKLGAMIVCTQTPKALAFQSAKRRFSEKFRIPLHIRTQGGEFNFAQALGFKEVEEGR